MLEIWELLTSTPSHLYEEDISIARFKVPATGVLIQ